MRVDSPNKATVDFFSGLEPKPLVVAEVGCYRGHTSRELLALLPPEGELHLYDFEETAKNVAERLGDDRIRVFGNSNKTFDSYNWSLIGMLEQHDDPIYDYVFIDGAHTWHHDALAFFLFDRLLKPGGFVDFDDYDWTLAASPSLNPETFPQTSDWYTQEQIESAQVSLVVDLLVRRDPRYSEIVENRIFEKLR